MPDYALPSITFNNLDAARNFPVDRDLMEITMPGRAGMFQYDPADITTPDDGALTLVTAGGKRFKRQVSDRRITPQMFGALGDGQANDGPALLAWLNAAGYEHFMPAGTYLSSTSLIRTNKGAITLRGAGPGKTVLKVMANINAINIANPAGGNLGLIQLEDFSIVPGVPITGKTAIYVASQHEQQPGVLVQNVTVDRTAGAEFSLGLNVHDGSSITINNFTFNGINNGAGQFLATGILIDNTTFDPPQAGTTGRPAVNYDLSNIQMTNVGTGIRVDAKGAPAIEGVAVRHARIVGCNRGFYATSTGYLATLITLDDFHSEGYGIGIDVDGYTQVQTNTALIYTNTPPSGVSAAPSSVRYNNAINFRGNLEIIAFAPIIAGVDMTGSCNNNALDVMFSCSYGESNGVRNGANSTNGDYHVNRLWSGQFGNNTGKKVLMLGTQQPRITGAPLDSDDIIVYRTPDANGVLDLRSVNSQYVVLPVEYTGTLTNILGYSGAQVTIQNESAININHTAGSQLWLAGNAGTTLPARSKISFKRTTTQWEEVSRTLPTQNVVQGISGVSRAGFITDITADLPSGFYTKSGSAGMPADPSGFNEWFVVVNRRENGAGNAGWWSAIYVTNIKTKATFVGGYDSQSSGLINWLPLPTGLRTGTSVQSGNGSATTFLIGHSSGPNAPYCTVQAGSSDAKNIAYIDRDGTSIYVRYSVAPPAGTNNLIFHWSAQPL